MFSHILSTFRFRNNTAEENALNSLLIIIIALQVFSAVFSYVNEMQRATFTAVTYLSTTLLFMVIPLKTRVRMYWLLFLILAFLDCVDWFILGGSSAGVNYFFLVLTIWTFLIVDTKQHIYYASAIILMLITLYYIEDNYPHLIQQTYSKPLYVKSKIGFSVAFLIFAFAISYLKKVFVNQRLLIASKNRELTELNQQRTTFFMNLVHETKTPLTLISNYFDSYVRKNAFTEELSIIQKYIDKLSRDITNYFDSEKIKMGKVLYTHNSVLNFSNYVKESIEIFKLTALKKEVTFESKIENNLHLMGDEMAIGRVLNNLLDNSIKYNHESGKVIVTLEGKEEMIQLKISDTGIGMSENELEQITELYYQISHSKRNSQGVGLGLYITKGIIEELGGDLRIESKKGRGTTVTISLPASTASTEEILHWPKNSLGSTDHYSKPELLTTVPCLSTKPVLLLIEDNVDLVRLVQKELEQDYQVLGALNGQEAFNILANNPVKPNIILSDIMMDEMDGLEFLRNLRNQNEYREVPFVFITAKDSEDERLQGLEEGAIDYINKPFSIKELKAKIATILMHDQEQKEAVLNKIRESVLSNGQIPRRPAEGYDNLASKCKKLGATKREIEIIELLIAGDTYHAIAEKLFISKKTVERHVNNIYLKFEVNNKVHLLNKLNTLEYP